MLKTDRPGGYHPLFTTPEEGFLIKAILPVVHVEARSGVGAFMLGHCLAIYQFLDFLVVTIQDATSHNICRFGHVTVCGEGALIKTFLSAEHVAIGKEVE